ncbi:MAG: FAD-binding oxidoreductase [Thermodesulfobacteriota bacterium]
MELSREQKRFLHGLFPDQSSLFEPEKIWIYGTDASRIFVPPLAVVRPDSVEQVKEFLAWADRERIPVFSRARGTNVVGACVPEQRGIVVSCLKMNRVLEIDEEDFTAVVEPGVVTADLQATVKARGLYYPPDPASVNISTIGGNVSTNAGGLRAVKYGVTGDYVLGLEAVLPGGELINTGGKVYKDVVGLDITSLLVGSEGTLAFYSKIILKLLSLPETSASVLIGFRDLASLMHAANRVFKSDLDPAAMEFMDQNTIFCLQGEGTVPLPGNVNALLLLQFDGSKDNINQELLRLNKMSRDWEYQSFQVAGQGKQEIELWEVRRRINPASFRMGPDKLSVDVSVPRGKLQKALDRIKKAGEDFGLFVLTFGHLGDGNIHVNVMYDSSDISQDTAAGKLIQKVMSLVLELGGSISGEHGVGLLKKPYLPGQLGKKERGLMQGIKQVFDPGNIMNPDKAF